MTARHYERHYGEAVTIAAAANDVFSHADDFARLSSHMNRPSAPMMGGRMDMSFDAARGQAVGSHVRMSGRIMGIALSLEEVITEREPPRRKVWETIGQPQIIVIDNYRLGFDIAAGNGTCELRVFIDYNLPSSAPARWFGYLFGAMYARWCVRQMLNDARNHFSAPSAARQVPALS